MKKLPVLKSLAFFGTILLVVFAYSFTSPKDHSSKDNINNISADDYPSVIIGSQVWMTENLNVDHFRNGDPIPEARSKSEWEKVGVDQKPAWCYYDNDPANGKIYGKLYNWYAVNDPRGLAPEGWHVPSDAEWTVLTVYLGGNARKDKLADGKPFWNTLTAGGKMKSTGTQYWKSPNEDATNSSGFSGLPGGLREGSGSFRYVGTDGNWWSSSEFYSDDAWSVDLYYKDGGAGRLKDSKDYGLSVRCLRD